MKIVMVTGSHTKGSVLLKDEGKNLSGEGMESPVYAKSVRRLSRNVDLIEYELGPGTYHYRPNRRLQTEFTIN